MPRCRRIDTFTGPLKKIVRCHKFHHGGVIVSMLLLLGLCSSQAFSQADFYAGKTITIIQDSSAGGVGHLRTNAVIGSLKKHILGNPNIVIQFMEGAGGRKAANYLFNNARPDGLTIDRVGSGFVSSPILGLPGVFTRILQSLMTRPSLHKSQRYMLNQIQAKSRY
jgi:tripartite-type tricarboxylate transporter receptor subunit TctC